MSLSDNKTTLLKEEFRSSFRQITVKRVVGVIATLCVLSSLAFISVPAVTGVPLEVTGPQSDVVADGVSGTELINYQPDESSIAFSIDTSSQRSEIGKQSSESVAHYRILTGGDIVSVLDITDQYTVSVPTDAGRNSQPLFEYTPPVPYSDVVFVLPLIFLVSILLYSTSSAFYERIDTRYDLYITTPASGGEIYSAILSPYVFLACIISVLYAYLLSLPPLGIAGVLSVSLIYLSVGVIVGTFTTSFENLTAASILSLGFLSVSLVVPVLFIDSFEIAKISPLYIIIAASDGVAIELSTAATSLLPALIIGLSGISICAYIFTTPDSIHKSPVRKLTYVSTAITSVRGMVFVTGFLVLPLTFIAEILILPIGFVLGGVLGGLAVLICVVIIEEVGKSTVFWLSDRSYTPRQRFTLGAFLGVGFLIGEKTIVYAQSQLVSGLSTGFQLTRLIAEAGNSVAGLVLLVFWPLIHPLATGVAAVGAGETRNKYLWYLTGAILLHLAYNLLGVISNV